MNQGHSSLLCVFHFKPIQLYLGCGEINWPFGLQEIDWGVWGGGHHSK